jgi:hypothetical protein
VVVLAAVAGCHSTDPIEAELRAREMELREVRDELACSRVHNQSMAIELRALRGEGYPSGVPGDHPPPVYPVRSIVLGRQTGGHPSDHGPGDDALQVQVEPHDAEGHTIKVPGSALTVQAVEISAEGLKRPLSEWEVPAEELRNTWRSGLFSSGYSVTLPWKVWPTSDRLRVIAQLRLLDGRAFEADKDVSVHLLPAPRHPAPAPAEVPTLPPPRSVPPSKPVLPEPKPLAPDKGPELPPADVPPPGVWHAPGPEPAAEMLHPVRIGDR